MNSIYLKELTKLMGLLAKEGIPFSFLPYLDGAQIVYPSVRNVVSDVVCHLGSYGNKEGLLEQMGLIDDEEDTVKGYLTAEEVFQMWKEDYQKNQPRRRF